MIYILCGNGKGKTTSSIGMGVRAVGNGKKVLMVQFLKTKYTGEYKAIKKIDNFDIESFGRSGFFLPKEQLEKKPELKEKFRPLSKEDEKLAQKALSFVSKEIDAKNYDLLILDEINVALNFGLLDIKSVVDLVDKYRDNTDIVLTGRYCPKQIMKLADMVSEVKEVEHYFKKGMKATRAREF
jgi:cob(I)alamin adenosyltransferase